MFAHVHLYLVPCVKRCFEGIDQPGSNITSTLKVRFLKTPAGVLVCGSAWAWAAG